MTSGLYFMHDVSNVYINHYYRISSVFMQYNGSYGYNNINAKKEKKIGGDLVTRVYILVYILSHFELFILFHGVFAQVITFSHDVPHFTLEVLHFIHCYNAHL